MYRTVDKKIRISKYSSQVKLTSHFKMHLVLMIHLDSRIPRIGSKFFYISLNYCIKQQQRPPRKLIILRVYFVSISVFISLRLSRGDREVFKN
jgi:hypothetical protein